MQKVGSHLIQGVKDQRVVPNLLVASKGRERLQNLIDDFVRSTYILSTFDITIANYGHFSWTWREFSPDFCNKECVGE